MLFFKEEKGLFSAHTVAWSDHYYFYTFIYFIEGLSLSEAVHCGSLVF